MSLRFTSKARRRLGWNYSRTGRIAICTAGQILAIVAVALPACAKRDSTTLATSNERNQVKQSGSASQADSRDQGSAVKPTIANVDCDAIVEILRIGAGDELRSATICVRNHGATPVWLSRFSCSLIPRRLQLVDESGVKMDFIGHWPMEDPAPPRYDYVIRVPSGASHRAEVSFPMGIRVINSKTRGAPAFGESVQYSLPFYLDVSLVDPNNLDVASMKQVSGMSNGSLTVERIP